MIGNNLEVADLFGAKPIKKSAEYPSVKSDSFKTSVGEYNMEKSKGYGKTTKISGGKIGTGIAAAGAIIPIVFPLPIAAAVGKIVADKVDNIGFTKGQFPTIQMKKKGKIW